MGKIADKLVPLPFPELEKRPLPPSPTLRSLLGWRGDTDHFKQIKAPMSVRL
ncbi:hypothetical protein [uncultured Pelagimonas sp.]|uniref:hypothetical protein n=1 Tax=uncultured Pelagimonas sp. TaxID=1618102 RepID=UPI00260DFC99|nr:hypothetical protein [uncultured Pelagimonas sp.]